MDHDIEKATNIKIILCAFEQLSGLKINFHKSEFFFVLDKLRRWNTITRNSLVVNLGYILFRYLGIPMHFRKLRNADWRIVEEKFEKKLSS